MFHYRENQALMVKMGSQGRTASLVKMADKAFLVHKGRQDLVEKMAFQERMAAWAHEVSG